MGPAGAASLAGARLRAPGPACGGQDSASSGEKPRRMQNETAIPQAAVKASEHTTGVAEHKIHPVLAEVLAEKEPDTITWVKG